MFPKNEDYYLAIPKILVISTNHFKYGWTTLNTYFENPDQFMRDSMWHAHLHGLNRYALEDEMPILSFLMSN